MADHNNPYEIVLVEDLEIVRLGLTRIIMSHFAEKVTIQEFTRKAGVLDYFKIRQAQKRRPDLVITDVSLPDGNGLELVGQLTDRYPQQKVLVISMHDEHVFTERAVRAGAKGYVQKDKAQSEIVDAITRILQGDTYFSPAVRDDLIQRAVGWKDKRKQGLALLSNSELDVFIMLGRSHTIPQIAAGLRKRPRTIERYCKRMRRKLKLDSQTALQAKAIEWNLSSL